MWSTTPYQTPEGQILDEHLRVLEDAVAKAEEGFPFFSKDVEKALDYFTARANRHGGINRFLYGMREKSSDDMAEGLALLKKHLG